MRRNKLSQISVGAGALDSPLEGVIKSSCRKHYVDNTNEIADEMSEGRDVGGAVPYKRDRIVFLFCPTMVVIVDLFLRRANAVRPYRFVAVILWFCTIFIQFSSFKQGAGSAFLCDQNLSSCSPNSR